MDLARNRLLILIFSPIIAMCSTASAESTQDLQEHLSIPIRWCAMQGSPAVENSTAESSLSTDNILRDRHTRATVFVWMPRSGVSFRSALTRDMRGRSGFPIIKDPHPPNSDGTGGPGVEGDILAPSFDHSELSELDSAITSCKKAWEKLEDRFETNFEGIIGINIRRFVKPNGTPTDLLGIGTSVHTVLAGTDKCEVPSTHTDYDPLMSNDGWVVVVDNSFTSQSDPFDSVLAHELGHVLFLGHGNGMDDPTGNPPRVNERFDTFCDRQEDVNADPPTLMKPISPVPDHLTELQRTSARAVARVTVGGTILQTGELQDSYIISDEVSDRVGDVRDPSVDLRSLGIHYNTIKGVTIISYRLVGHLPQHPNHRFLVFVDVDANPSTGGNLASLGYQTQFKGAEFVTEVVVKSEEGKTKPLITPAVWTYRSGKFVKLPPDPRIKADITTAILGHTGKFAYDVVSLQLPQGFVNPRPEKVRFQASAERIGGAIDRLPDKEEYGRLIRLTKPQFPSCRAIPDASQPGAQLSIETTGFLPQLSAEIYFDHEPIGKGTVDDKGKLSVQVRVPTSAQEGLHLIVVAEQQRAMTAHCALKIKKGVAKKNSD